MKPWPTSTAVTSSRFLPITAKNALQVEGNRPQCVRSGSTSDELQIAIEDWMAE